MVKEYLKVPLHANLENQRINSSQLSENQDEH
jgi:hypothetical protein